MPRTVWPSACPNLNNDIILRPFYHDEGSLPTLVGVSNSVSCVSILDFSSASVLSMLAKTCALHQFLVKELKAVKLSASAAPMVACP